MDVDEPQVSQLVEKGEDLGRLRVCAVDEDRQTEARGFWHSGRMSAPPDGLPVYRVLTGPDDETFCRRVSEAIALGYSLHVGPALAFNGERVIVAQALVWPENGENRASRD